DMAGFVADAGARETAVKVTGPVSSATPFKLRAWNAPRVQSILAGTARKFAIDPAANAGTLTTARISSLGIASTRLRVRNSPPIFVIPSSIAQVGCASPRKAISGDGGKNVSFALCETKPRTMQFRY